MQILVSCVRKITQACGKMNAETGQVANPNRDAVGGH